MAGVIFGVFCMISVLCAAATGNMEAVGAAVFSGTEEAVSLMLMLTGSMCLWNGLLAAAGEMGALSAVQRLLAPLLSRIFPELCTKDKHDDGGSGGLGEVTASIAANFLGIGNAATPIGLRAMEILRQYRTDPTRMCRAEIAFVLINTAPPTLLPTTLLSLRHAAHAQSPTAVLPAIWVVSLTGFFFAAWITRRPDRMSRRTSRGKRRGV